MSTADLEGPKIVVNPDDFARGLLAEAKALAALHGATIVANSYCPEGRVLVFDLPEPTP